MKSTKIAKFIDLMVLLLLAVSITQPVAAEKIQNAPATKGVPTFWYPVSYEVGEGVDYSVDSTKHLGADTYAIDFLVPKNSVQKKYGIYPTLPGRVVYADCTPVAYGCVVAIRHWDDAQWDKKYYSIYAHLDSIINVSVGNLVDTTNQIGWMGKTGTGANNIIHLHFAVRSSDNVYDGTIALYGQYDKDNVITPAFNVRPFLSLWYFAWLPNLWD